MEKIMTPEEWLKEICGGHMNTTIAIIIYLVGYVAAYYSYRN